MKEISKKIDELLGFFGELKELIQRTNSTSPETTPVPEVPEIEVEIEPEPQPEPEIESGTNEDPDPQPEPEIESGTNEDPEPEVEVEIEPLPELEPEPDDEIDIDNHNSKIGAHGPSINYYGSGSPAFANLWWSAVGDLKSVCRISSNNFVLGKNGDGSDWSGVDTFNEMGWPYRTLSDQDINVAKDYRSGYATWVCHEGWRKERFYNILNLRGSFSSLPTAVKPDTGNRAIYDTPDGFDRNVTFKMSVYWQGTGKCNVICSQGGAAGGGKVPLDSDISTISFTGPDNEGPYGDGVETMNKITREYTANTKGGASISVSVTVSDRNDPVRNIIVLVSDVRDSITGEILFDGWDENTYTPFALYPVFIESHKHFKVLRSLNFGPSGNGIQHHEQHRGRTHNKYTDPIVVQKRRYTGPDENGVVDVNQLMEWYPVGWVHTNHPSGYHNGLGAISNPRHSCFGASPRAFIEICNQLNADVWWCHPPNAVYPGQRTPQGDIPAAELGSSGELLCDEEYVRGFSQLVKNHLKSNLKVWTEYGNEIGWNWLTSFNWGSNWVNTMGARVLAEEKYGGDGKLLLRSGELEEPAIHAGAEMKTNENFGSRMYQAAASALIAKAMREEMVEREVVCVGAGQSNGWVNTQWGLGMLWAGMPKLFRELDVYAHAPYRSPTFDPEMKKGSGAVSDEKLVELGNATAAWDYLENTQKQLEPYYVDNPDGEINRNSYWGSFVDIKGNFRSPGYWFFTTWKSVCLDQPQPDNPMVKYRYSRVCLPPGYDKNKRRWNLKLVSYECGNHYIPSSHLAKLLVYPVVLEPRYETFQRRYLECAFAPWRKGLTRNPETQEEMELYREGMVPMGIEEKSEPLHDMFVFLSNIGAPDYRHGFAWGFKWWIGHENAPQYVGTVKAIKDGIGTSNWWLDYNKNS
jgi:hypothetical protein